MIKHPFKKIAFFSRPEVFKAKAWEKKISSWLKKRYPKIKILGNNIKPLNKKETPDLLIVLGGDGTIIEASQKYQRWNPLIFGLNLGHVGFLASIREPKNFLNGLARLLRHNYKTSSRMMISVDLKRNGKKIFSSYALNDIAVQNLLGIVDIEVLVEGHPVQYIHGNGVLISTATGSTAYNLSAHGPVVMPDIKCMIITELLDHNIPTPSLIIKRNRIITLKVGGFRKKNKFLLGSTQKTVDVILTTDTERIVALEKGDVITIKKSERLVRFVELEKNYFFKSLQEKFAFR